MAGKKQDERIIGGLALILLGVVFILNNMVGWGAGWPFFILYGGAMVIVNMAYGVEKGKDAIVGVIVLFIIGSFFLLFTTGLLQWSDMAWLWPVFMMAPGIGLLIHYFLGGDHDAMTGGSILLVLGFIFLTAGKYGWTTYWPVALIGIGFVIVLADLLKRRKA